MKPEPKKGELNDEFGFHVERPFLLQSTLNPNRYLDILGKQLVIKTRNGYKSQLWWFDQKTKTIKSQKNKNMSWNIQGSGSGKNFQVYNTNGLWYQVFTFENNQVINIKNKEVVEVQDNKDEEGQPVVLGKNDGGINQKWNVVYEDTAAKIRTSGLNKDFGFMINEPFFIVSKMWLHRVA
jgi:hypothetical protein